MAVIFCLLCHAVIGSGVAAAQSAAPISTTSTAAVPPSAAPPASTPPDSATPGTVTPGTDNPGTDNPGTDNPGTTPPGTAAPSVPTTTAASTIVNPSTTTTTVTAAQLAALIDGLGRDMAQAQAVSDYLAARSAANSAGSGQPLPAGADPVLVQAATAQLQASADRAAAQQRFAQARHAIAQVAIALYLGEQVPHAGSAIVGSLGDRSTFLAGVLDGAQRDAIGAKTELARATAAADQRRQDADRLVQARTAELQAAAIQAALAARAQPTTTATDSRRQPRQPCDSRRQPGQRPCDRAQPVDPGIAHHPRVHGAAR